MNSNQEYIEVIQIKLSLLITIKLQIIQQKITIFDYD